MTELRTKKEIKKALKQLEKSRFALAQDFVQVLEWVLGKEPMGSFGFYTNLKEKKREVGK